MLAICTHLNLIIILEYLCVYSIASQPVVKPVLCILYGYLFNPRIYWVDSFDS